MKTRKMFTFLIIALVVMSILFVFMARSVKAQGEEVLSQEISKKLDDVINSQKQIMDAIDSMKAELAVIKIRITQQQ